MARMKDFYKETVAPALFKKFGYKSVMQIPKLDKIVVNVACGVTKHVKPKQAGQLGGRVQAEGALYASKVQLVCPKCDKLTRVAHKIEDGKKIRVCKHCGAELKY